MVMFLMLIVMVAAYGSQKPSYLDHEELYGPVSLFTGKLGRVLLLPECYFYYSSLNFELN